MAFITPVKSWQTAKKILKTSLITLVAMVALLCSVFVAADAGVNKKNGNFYISYTDLIVGIPEFEIVRTYNSKSNQTLSFGFGWGSDLDTSLVVAGDGSVVVTENGSGAERIYIPSSLDSEERQLVVETMLVAMEGAGWISSDAQLRETRELLSNDGAKRRNLHTDLVGADLMPARDIAIGERLTSSATPSVTLEREPGGYYRRGPEGHERFDLNGKLVEMAKKDGSGYKLRRNAQGHLREIIANNGEEIAVTTNSNGQITRLSTGDLVATYRYDDKNNLISGTNVVNTTFDYEYDEKHNMRFIRYEDGQFQEMRYSVKTYFINYLSEKNGRTTKYDYGKNEIREAGIIEHYYTHTRTYDSASDQTPVRDQKVAYRIGRDRYGNAYTAGITTTENSVTTERRYHPCGSPVLIERGNRRTEFGYDDDCRLTYKKTNSEEIRLEYESRNSKISRVETTDLYENKTAVSEFKYNLRGELSWAKDSKGKSVELWYNEKNQIHRLLNQDGEALVFKYGRLGKPIQIGIEGVGKIDVTYDSSGEIENVASDQGHQMALRVTQAFQALLALVKPAGVNFNL